MDEPLARGASPRPPAPGQAPRPTHSTWIGRTKRINQGAERVAGAWRERPVSLLRSPLEGTYQATLPRHRPDVISRETAPSPSPRMVRQAHSVQGDEPKFRARTRACKGVVEANHPWFRLQDKGAAWAIVPSSTPHPSRVPRSWGATRTRRSPSSRVVSCLASQAPPLKRCSPRPAKRNVRGKVKGGTSLAVVSLHPVLELQWAPQAPEQQALRTGRLGRLA